MVVINAAKVKLTGKKLEEKVYYRHTTYPGGIRTTTAGKILESKKAQRLVEIAGRGMLPIGSVGIGIARNASGSRSKASHLASLFLRARGWVRGAERGCWWPLG